MIVDWFQFPMINKWQDLARLPLFQQVPTRELKELANSSTLYHFTPDYLFYTPDRINQTLYILVQGEILLYRISPEGKKLNLARLRKSAIFGETALFEDDLPTHFAQAIGRCCVIAMSSHNLMPLVNKYPQISLQMLRMVSNRLYVIEEKLENVAFKPLRARLADLLLKLAEEQGSDTITGYTHQDLAEDLGTCRETTTSLLNDLRLQGMITIRRKRIDLVGNDNRVGYD